MKPVMAILLLTTITTSCSKVTRIGQDIESLNKQTEKLYQQSRSKEAESARNANFEVLEKTNKKFTDKVTAAATYFKSFEFQIWAADKKNKNQVVGDKLLADAANDFTKRIDILFSRLNTNKMKPDHDGRKSGAQQSFYALAVTMHMNPFYPGDLIGDEAQNNGNSFYDLIKESLRQEMIGGQLAEHHEILLSGIYKPIILELIKARVDMMAALAVDNLTEKKGMSTNQHLGSTLFKVTDGFLGAIELPETFNKISAEKKKQTVLYLQAAVNAKAFLHEVSHTKIVEKTVRSALKNIDFKDDQASSENQEYQEDSDLRRIEITDLINELVK